MTAKRFEVIMNEFDEVEYIMDKEMMEDRDFVEFIDFVEDVCKENERLKKELQIYYKVVGCFNCRYHNYDWYDDGDEFEVCDKGNDVTEGICKEWEEL